MIAFAHHSARTGAFTDDVLEPSGLINVVKMATVLKQPLIVIAPAVGKSVRRLRESPTMQSVQPKASQLLRLINDLAEAFNDQKRYVVLYFNTQQPDLENRTPADLLRAGKLDVLAGYIDEVVTIRPA